MSWRGVMCGRLQGIALAAGYALPMVLLLPGLGWLTGLAVVLHLAGVAASRWLFFAQTEHRGRPVLRPSYRLIRSSS